MLNWNRLYIVYSKVAGKVIPELNFTIYEKQDCFVLDKFMNQNDCKKKLFLI